MPMRNPNRVTLLALTAAFLVLQGCAVTPVRVYSDPSAAPRKVMAPADAAAAGSSDEPMVCLFSFRQPRKDWVRATWFMESGQFHAYRYLTVQNASPRGCGVLVAIRQTGTSVLGTSYVDVYSAHEGSLLEQEQAEGYGGPVMGYQVVARYLKVALAPGQPLRSKLDATSDAPRVDTAWVRKKAGGNLLDWDDLIGQLRTDDPQRRVLAAMRDKELAAPKWDDGTLSPQQFEAVVRQYRAAHPRPAVSEEVRRYEVMAEDAIRNKRFEDAVGDYGKALRIAPWWPQGRFNMALILGELHYYDDAIDQMNKYLKLAPEARNARAAQDQVYRWESEKSAGAAAR